MADTIGDCKCINSLDKDEIILAITNEIERIDEKIENIKKGEIKGKFTTPETLIKMNESIKHRMINETRVENTPIC